MGRLFLAASTLAFLVLLGGHLLSAVGVASAQEATNRAATALTLDDLPTGFVLTQSAIHGEVHFAVFQVANTFVVGVEVGPDRPMNAYAETVLTGLREFIAASEGEGFEVADYEGPGVAQGELWFRFGAEEEGSFFGGFLAFFPVPDGIAYVFTMAPEHQATAEETTRVAGLVAARLGAA